VLPTASIAHTVYDFVPAASGLLAVSALLRQPYMTPPMTSEPAVSDTFVDPVVTKLTFARTWATPEDGVPGSVALVYAHSVRADIGAA